MVAARSRREERAVLRPIDQITPPPGNTGMEATGAWAYYLRPDGATIGETLVLYPNGGRPEMDDRRLADRYGINAEYYQQRQARKGFEYVGPKLTEGAMKRLVEILASNREEEVAYLRAEIADAEDTVKNADIPEVRTQGRRRVNQLKRRLATIEAGFDPDELLAELNEIARAQQLAKVDPNVLRVMRAMIGEANATLIAHFQNGTKIGEGAPGTMTTRGNDKGASL
jgi:hypothetical protein